MGVTCSPATCKTTIKVHAKKQEFFFLLLSARLCIAIFIFSGQKQFQEGNGILCAIKTRFRIQICRLIFIYKYHHNVSICLMQCIREKRQQTTENQKSENFIHIRRVCVRLCAHKVTLFFVLSSKRKKKFARNENKMWSLKIETKQQQKK